jgi:hypothetical protein
MNVPDWAMAPTREGTAVAAALSTAELDELRLRMAAAQRSIVAARARRRQVTAGEVLDARADLMRRHLVEAHGWSAQGAASVHPDDLPHIHKGLMDAERAGELAAGTPHDEFGRALAVRKVAHESADGVTAAHCPFCGSGQLVGLSDGSIECGYCQSSFTVRLQPTFPAMPQTLTGLPQDPGMMASPGMEGPPPPGALPPGAGPDPMADPSMVLVGPDGQPLPKDQFLAQLAARYLG